MTNFERIDDFLTNRLEGKEKEEFERQLESDPTLKADVDLQRHIVEGIKSARVLELKSMLNNVPVSSGFTFDFTVARLAAGLIGAGVVFASVYFFMKPDSAPNLKNASADLGKKNEQVQKSVEPTAPVSEETAVKKDSAAAPQENKLVVTKPVTKTEAKARTSNESKQPKIEVIDPSAEMNASENEPAVSSHTTTTGVVAPSRIEVTTDTENKKYAFHYQFTFGKLHLYGPFDRSLYEILEINGESHSVFLFYKDNYYSLDEKQQNITRLEPIADATLIKKLKEYRGK